MDINITTHQTLYLGSGVNNIKVYFQGDGCASYLVTSSTLTQGSKSVNVKCLGKTSFYVPAYGRWSDTISTVGFTIPGYVTLNVAVIGDVPTINIENKNIITENGPISRVRSYGTITGFPINDPCTSLDGWEKNEVLGTVTIQDGYRFYANEITVQDNESIAALIKTLALSAFPSKFTVEVDLLVDKFGDEFTVLEGEGNWEGSVVVPFIFEINNIGQVTIGFTKNEINHDAWCYGSLLFRATEGVEEKWKFNFNFISSTRYILSVYKNDVFYKQIEYEVYGFATESVFAIGVYNSAQSKSIGYTEAHIKSLKIWLGDIEGGAEDITESGNDAISVTQDGTITVLSQPSAGDTLTVTYDGQTYTFTFVDTLPKSDYEILIGSDTTLTAANIASALNNLPGALIEATSSGNVVTVKVYSENPVTVSTTASGLIISGFYETTLYYSNHTDGYLPAITAWGEATQRGLLGDIYGLLTFPKMTSTGEATRSGNIGNTYIPMITSSGWIFKATGSSSSTNAEKEAFLLCGDSWMETFASMVIAPGTWDEIALQAVRWVADFIAYTTDTGLDNWKDPIHTLYDGFGDCEDGAFLTASLIRNMGVPYSNIRVYIGETSGVGHAWIMYRRTSDNQWVSLDWTAGSAYWSGITSVDNLTALYSSVLEIQEQSLNPDDYAYGSAVEYITCSDVISLANGKEYSDSLYSPTYSLTIEDSFPSLLFNAYSGGYITDNFPSLLFSATGILSPTSALKLSFPVLRFSANAIQSALSSINLTNPALRFSASGIISSIISLSAIAPSLIFKATGFTGDSGKIIKSFPSLKFTATAHWTGNNTIDIDIPFVLFNALARNSVILDADGRKVAEGLALCMNTKNFSMTEYDNYGYNSLFEFNGKIFGATSTGIHELTGDTDNNNPVLWRFKIGKIDLEKNIKTKARYIWLSYRSSGDLILTIDDGENQYEYDVESYKQIDNAVRIKIGKGLRNRFIQIELENVNGASMTFDHLRLFSDLTKKKR